MNLAVNIGNTNIRAALGDTDNYSQAVFYLSKDMGKENFIHEIERKLGNDVWDKASRSIIASVVPAYTNLVVEILEQKTGGPVARVDINNCGKLDISRYKGKLGEDRAVCCAGAMYKHKPPFVLIDFGTATTFNVVNKDGIFMGGAIMAGLQTGLKALAESTAQLPAMSNMWEKPKVIGTDTMENLLSGAILGTAGAAEGFIDRIKAEIGEEIKVVATGGHAPAVLPVCRFPYIHEPSLLLEGLLSL